MPFNIYSKTIFEKDNSPRISQPYFTVLACVCISIMLISNITTTVPVIIGPINSDGAFYLFPLAYVIEDIITEVYGLSASRKVIFTGFGMLIFAAICFHLSAILPHGDNESQIRAVQAYTSVATASLRFIIAGLTGYLCGGLINTTIISVMKAYNGEKKLWLRLLTATLASEFIDTAIFCTIAAPALGYSFPSDVANYTIVGFVWKSLAGIIVMPITYWACNYLKKYENNYC